MPNHVSDVILDFILMRYLHVHKFGCDCTVRMNQVWTLFYPSFMEHCGFCRPEVIQLIWTSRLEITNSQNYATTDSFLLLMHSVRWTMKIKKRKKQTNCNFSPCSNFSQVKKAALTVASALQQSDVKNRPIYLKKKTEKKQYEKVMLVLMYILLFLLCDLFVMWFTNELTLQWIRWMNSQTQDKFIFLFLFLTHQKTNPFCYTLWLVL